MFRRRAEYFLLCYCCVVFGFHKSLVVSEITDGLMGGEDWFLDGIPTQTTALSERNPIVDAMPCLPPRVKRDTERSSRKCDQLHTEFDRFRKSLKDELVEALTEKIAEIKGLENKVEVLRSQVKKQQKRLRIGSETIERLDKENKRLQKNIDGGNCQEEKSELAWLKTKFLNNSNWNTELHLAASRTDEEEVKKLVENGAYINARNKRGDTPLIRASFGTNQTTSLRIIKFLIDNGADGYAKDNSNNTFLNIFVLVGTSLSPSEFHDLAEYLVSKNMSALFNVPGWSGTLTPLEAFVRDIEIEPRTLKLLHDNKVDFSHEDSMMIFAIWRYRSSTFLDNLIKLGANYQRLTQFKDNLLHTAASVCHVEAAKLFMRKGYFDVNAQNYYGNTPLHNSVRTCSKNIFETVGVLIENGANVKIKNKLGQGAQTPLDIEIVNDT